jgi:hypothetical protein
MTRAHAFRRSASRLATILSVMCAPAAAQSNPDAALPAIHAARAVHPPLIDGRLIDEAWAAAEPATTFTQRDPDEGMAPTERTEIRFLFDDSALYVAARLFDSEPTHIMRRLSMRDNGGADADVISIYVDPMHDHLTGAIFRVSAANVQQDSILFNDTWTEGAWDAVWQSAVTIDEMGWSAEMRIPLSQLRFNAADKQTWGVNVERHIRRKNEYDWLSMVPKNESGTASRMLDLTGLDDIKPTRRVELLPYAGARNEFIAPESGNPFNDGSRAFAAAGLDAKLGVTSNLTATATVNPDFGQVEVDPAVVNLSAFETFFEEKRPFFLEGSQIFSNYGRGGSNSFWGFNNSEPQIFYSRRIGRAPQISLDDDDHKDVPAATTILGAVKLTGKTDSGWSLGLLEAVTSREDARISNDLTNSRSIVEPFTNYAVARVQRDIGRRFGVGMLSTSVRRRLETNALRDALVESAYVAGSDAYLFLDEKRDWVIVGNIAASRVNGSSTVIEKLQKAAQRYFQRPDAPHVRLDPTRTSLSGYTGRINLNRNSGLWQVNAALWAGSPGFESNDLGFLSTGDRAGMHAVLLFRDVKTRRYSRSWNAWIAKYYTWNFGRELQSNGLSASANWNSLNYWNINTNVGRNWRTLDDRLTRGGPSAEAPGGSNWNINVNSDSRKRMSLGAGARLRWTDEGGWSRNVNANLAIKPSERVILTLGPTLDRSSTVAQYVTSVTDATATSTYGARYVFGALDQTQVAMTTRVSVILSPTVSVQVYAQPLIAAGDYFGFKELARPRAFDFAEYGSALGTIFRDAAEKEYVVDPDSSNAAESFRFDDPDFSLRSLKVNAVFRWELKPGSTFYVVWTRQQKDEANPGSFNARRDTRAMLRAPGDDVLLFKIAYWIGR